MAEKFEPTNREELIEALVWATRIGWRQRHGHNPSPKDMQTIIKLVTEQMDDFIQSIKDEAVEETNASWAKDEGYDHA